MATDPWVASVDFEKKMLKLYEKHMRAFTKIYKEEWRKSKMRRMFEEAGEDADEAYVDIYSGITDGRNPV